MKRNRITIGLLVVVAALLAFLLLPPSSRRFTIEFDEAAIRRKTEYLKDIRDSGTTLSERPNIVMILADDLSYTDISLMGGSLVETPNIDSIGNSGVVFTNAYCSSSICAPSRASMLTGRYQQRFGFELQPNTRYATNRLEYFVFKHVLDIGFWRVADLAVPKKADREKQGVPPSEVMLSEVLQAAGYTTGILGKWHLGAGDDFIPNSRGFDYQYGFYEAHTLYADPEEGGIINNRLDEFSDRQQWKRGRKGLSAIRINDEVIEEDEYLTDRIAEETVEFIRENRGNPFFAFVPFNAPHVPYQVPESYFTRMSHIDDFSRRVYAAMVQSLDDAVGYIMDELEVLGLAKNTLVIFASDNGGAFFTGAMDNGRYKGGKFTNFDGGLRVPLMIRWPGRILPDTLYEDQVGLFDLFPTVTKAAGIADTESLALDGVDLVPFINGAAAGEVPHRILFWKTLYNRAVKKGKWKLIINDWDSSRLLYNIEIDEAEKHDLTMQHPDVVDELYRELLDWERELVPPLWPRVMDVEFSIDGMLYRFAI